MSIAALSAGVSGLTANQRALDVSAHNVANASTAGFQPQQASFQEAEPAGSGVTLSASAQSLSRSDPAAPSGTDLARETGNSLVYSAQASLTAKLIQTQDQTLGSLINTQA